MIKTLTLFHRIGEGGEDSAAVRQFLVTHQLTHLIEFQNIAYEGAQAKLRELIGVVEAPVLVVADSAGVDGGAIRGRDKIIACLSTHASKS